MLTDYPFNLRIYSMVGYIILLERLYEYFLFKSESISLLVGPLTPCFGLILTSSLGFKARIDPLIFLDLLHQLHVVDSSDCSTSATPAPPVLILQ